MRIGTKLVIFLVLEIVEESRQLKGKPFVMQLVWPDVHQKYDEDHQELEIGILSQFQSDHLNHIQNIFLDLSNLKYFHCKSSTEF